MGEGFVCVGPVDPDYPGLAKLPPMGLAFDENTPLAATVASQVLGIGVFFPAN